LRGSRSGIARAPPGFAARFGSDPQIESAHSRTGRSERFGDGFGDSFGDKGETALGYLIAAYAIVIGSLCAYALKIHGQRRKLISQGEQDPNDSRRV
jgi:hypothetical protein